ncbi:MAG: GDSL-type esterase/lipase family protein [Verrucomicrobiae bacterium]|nr:GDSL-type esterase/lipase family protein [Verrucomicrobiae bacterium]
MNTSANKRMTNKLKPLLMRQIQILLLVVAFAAVAFDTQSAEKLYRIMPVGDSITEGGAAFSCYRYLLWRKLVSAGYLVEFVGSKIKESSIGPLRYEAFSGQNAEFIAEMLEKDFSSNSADILLIHSGHNHNSAKKPIPGIIKATESMINTARSINPDAIVMLAQVIPSGKLPKYEYIPQLNTELKQLAERENTPEQWVININMADGFDWRTDTIEDHVHPNAYGAEKIAEHWFEALTNVMEPPTQEAHCLETASGATGITNRFYKLELLSNNAVSIKGADCRAFVFKPDFKIFYTANNPKITSVLGPEKCNIKSPQWKKPDGFVTMDYLKLEKAINISAVSAVMTNGAITWTFAHHPLFKLVADITLPESDGEPKVSFTLTPSREGFFSVGYCGSPQFALHAIDALWQPEVWQQKRFPSMSILSLEHMCSLVTTMLTVNSNTFGLVADPEFLPFRLPTLNNSRCGVLLRNEAGQAQPMFFAPVLGEADSKLSTKSAYTATFRIIVRQGDIYDSFRYLARHLYGVGDMRQNESCSLNTTIQNMIEFALDDNLSGWNADLHGCDYSTDVKNTVKVVSALHPMSVAMITDRQEIFDQRAMPMVEYLISREKYLFTTATNETDQGASAKMGGPTGEVFEWSSLFHFSEGRSWVLRQSAFQRFNSPRALNLNVVSGDSRWVDNLALYRLTGEGFYLIYAKALADAYISNCITTPQTNFPEHAEFWVDFTPRWMQLLELYQDAGDERYLLAAETGAEEYSRFCAMSPAVPSNKVQIQMSIYRTNTVTVPAWRVSQVGLTPEAANTYMDNAAIFLTHYAPFYLRLARLRGDEFFSDIAHNAVVGRYANYPGYSINHEFSTAYADSDYPTTLPVRNKRYNLFYFNHIWPHIALLFDYLITDAEVRSRGQICFPARYAQGYAYLQSRVYGDRPGSFCGDTNVWLYMPRGAVKSDSTQINYISARGNDKFYFALMNQSPNKVVTTASIEIPGIDANATYSATVWLDHGPAKQAILRNGSMTLSISAKGIAAVAIDGLKPIATYQDKVLDAKVTPTTGSSYVIFTNTPIGQVSGMLFSFGRGLNNAYVWLAADATVLQQAKLIYRCSDGAWHEMTDSTYPFEFNVPIDDLDSKLEFRVEGVLNHGHRVVSTDIKSVSRN